MIRKENPISQPQQSRFKSIKIVFNQSTSSLLPSQETSLFFQFYHFKFADEKEKILILCLLTKFHHKIENVFHKNRKEQREQKYISLNTLLAKAQHKVHPAFIARQC